MALDLRSLAVFRVALGALLLADLAFRAVDLRAFFTDLGVLPRASFASVNADWVFSLHLATGGVVGAALIFAVSALAALALLAGFHTRAASLACAVLWHSLHARNVYANDGGDMLLFALLFWALFLPLGARLSLDALRAPPRLRPPETTHGVVATAYLLQLFVVYALAAVHKAHSHAWTRGETLWYVTHLDQFATPLALWLGPHTIICHLGTWGALALELLGPMLLFIPWRVDKLRAVAALAFIGLHFGFGALLRLGIFPWVGVVAWTAVVPWPIYRALALRLRLDRARAWLPAVRALLPAGAAPEAEAGTTTRALVGFAAAAMLLWNLTTVSSALRPLQALFEPAIHALRLDQEWLMFDGAPSEDGWFVVPATLADGTRVDALTSGPVRFDKPDDIAARYGDQRWRDWQKSMSDPTNEALLPLWAGWLCRAWNDAHPPAQRATAMEIDWISEPTLPDREGSLERQRRLVGGCIDAPQAR